MKRKTKLTDWENKIEKMKLKLEYAKLKEALKRVKKERDKDERSN